MKIITNNKPRKMLYGYELTEKERKEFDYLSDEEITGGDFFRYKNQVYDLTQAQITNINGWDGVFPNSYFSGVLVKIIDCDAVIVGRHYA